MKSSTRKLLRLCGLGAAGATLLLVLYVVALLLAEEFYGGPHITTVGEAHGFKIGMTKAEFFQRYRELNEAANISCHGPGPTDGCFALERKSADLKFSGEFESSDHWMAYRDKFPIYFQEFAFSDGRLTNIMTYIRFYETP